MLAKLSRCPCEIAVLAMISLGAEHAARMHERGGTWSSEDWFVHLDEEEDFFFPVAVDVYPGLVEKLLEQHATFRRELVEHDRIVSTKLLEEHAHLENVLAESLVDRGIIRIASSSRT